MLKNIRTFKLKLMLAGIGLVLCASTFAQTQAIDSLNTLLENSKGDTTEVNTLHELALAYYSSDPGKAAEFTNKSHTLAKRLDYRKGIADNLFTLACLANDKGNYALALSQFDRSLEIREQLKDKAGISDCLYKKGDMARAEGDFKKALDYLQKSLALRNEIKDTIRIGDSYNGIGSLYLHFGNYEEALAYFLKAVKFFENSGSSERTFRMQTNIGAVYFHMEEYTKALEFYLQGLKNPNKISEANAYNNVGSVYLKKEMYPRAEENFLRALTLYDQIGYKSGTASTSMNLGYTYTKLKKFNKAREYNFKALKLAEELKKRSLICNCNFSIAEMYQKQGDLIKAREYSKNGVALAKEYGLNGHILPGYEQLFEIYVAEKDYKNALENYQLYTALKDSIFSKEKTASIAELETKYETDKKEKEIQVLTKDKELKDKLFKEQRTVRLSLTGGVILLCILSLVLYGRFRFKKKANALLEKQNQLIEEKNTQITDSIDYAKTIQEAILPSVSTVQALFPESFILFKPKAIVSGDFYWVAESGNKIICAVADCTGHGVPGAFMSMLGNNILDNVIKKEAYSPPSVILDTLNEEVIRVMAKGKERSSVKDGMDIALIAVDPAAKKLEYAGAKNSMYLIRGGELTEVKADKFSIGSLKKTEAVHFTNNSFDLQKDDVIYLFSDGYADQIGGPYRKKLYYQTFKDLLLSISTLDMDQQKRRLDETIVNWKADYEQTDDILVVGIKCG
ncbi:MAG TPA: tetratricopeptide repeat protein [Bacteroidia bacterium]|jgi:serine phosphatase RsbU (regulator of sigma subunit)